MKKKQQKKQLVSCLDWIDKSLFWSFLQSNQQIITSIDTWFTNFDKQLKALQQDNLVKYYSAICKSMGVHPHPCILGSIQQQGKTTIDFKGYRIDYASIKILHFISSQFQIYSIKLSNNQIEPTVYPAFLAFINNYKKLSSLNFDWNQLNKYPEPSTFYQEIVNMQGLQYLTLRSCKISDGIIPALTKLATSQTTQLLFLDLNDNLIGSQVVPSIVQLIKENKKLTQLGLGCNMLNQTHATSILTLIGSYQPSAQKLAQIAELQKQKQLIIDRNKKRKRGAPQQPLPKIPIVVKDGEKSLLQQNMILQTISLSRNQLSGTSKLVQNTLKRVPKLKLIYHSNLSQSQGQKLSNKFNGRFLI